MSEVTILMFDSGVGGLSVFQDIKARIPNLSCTYIFDNQAYPYGELPQEELISRTCQYVTQFIESNHIDLVVIACNTASTVVLPRLREILSIPVVGVVPAIKPASQKANLGVGLIATPATITREYTHDLIKDFASDKDVKLLGSTALVDMAEDKLRKRPVDLARLSDVLQPLRGNIDVAVLGCTHFPLLKEEIQQVMGKGVTLVDSGEAIARRVEFLLRDKIKANGEHPLYQVYCSAEVEAEESLQSSLTEMGFSTLKIHPLLGV